MSEIPYGYCHATINDRSYKLIPVGRCACGCNGLTKISKINDKHKKWTKGEPKRYIKGHHANAAHFPNKRGAESHNWKGGRIDRNGYIHVYSPNHPYATSQGYVPEHRLVLEKVLGRYLTPKEVPHHINGKKKDNRPENLRLHESKGKHVVLEGHVDRNPTNGQFVSPGASDAKI